MATIPQHIFVLMLENRSFDHMFGFSGISGTDAVTGDTTRIDGLSGSESNAFGGVSYTVTANADYVMPVDPGHEFPDVLRQLAGPNAAYTAPYPKIDNSGFVASYAAGANGNAVGEIMKCFDTRAQLPVLYALAQEFAFCDRWFSSMPGPTWPNRMFVHAASSAGLDHSPSTSEILEWESVAGLAFKNGSIYQLLKAHQRNYHLYSGDFFPTVAALKGIQLTDVHRIDTLISDLKQKTFPYDYVFIEPSYDIFNDYRKSSSQHPLADVRDGEALIKTVYEALRNSPIWEKSLLVLVWDEHGGFYDHAAPPRATPPGDTAPKSKYNQFGFTFEQYGVRVPALVISPFVPRNTIDHRLYDHASIPATVEASFGLPALTARDKNAANLLPLLSLSAPRTCPTSLPTPAVPAERLAALMRAPAIGARGAAVARPQASVNTGMLPSFVHAAMRAELEIEKAKILARVGSLKTRQDAVEYVEAVEKKMPAR